MAGGYPTAPEQRLAYDLDGSIVIRRDDDTLDFEGLYSSAIVQGLNNEHSSGAFETAVFDGRITQWLFPGPRDLFGVWASGDGDSAFEDFFVNIETSGDTRSWNSGSWSSAGVADFRACTLIWDTWRRDIRTFSAEEQWGFRGQTSGKAGLEFVGKILHQVHIYGALTDSYYPDRIIVLDKSTGLELTLFDWGYVPRGVEQTKDLQIKNNSTRFRANDVTLSFDSLNTNSPDSWHGLSDGGAGYVSSLNVGTLEPDETYGNDITMRVVPITSAGMGPWTNRLVVGVSSWEDIPANMGSSQGTGNATTSATLEISGLVLSVSTGGTDISATLEIV